MKKKKGLLQISLCVVLLLVSLNSWAAKLIIQGSTTVYPIAKQASEAYMKEHPHVQIEVVPSGSGNGIKALIDGTTDIASASRFIKDNEVKIALEKGIFPVAFRVAYDCIVPVVHPSNPVKNLTMGQLKQIYQGRISDWRQVGGKPGQILVVSRDTSSGTYEVWLKKVMQKESFLPSVTLCDSNQKVMQTVSQYSKAIGYVGLGYVNPTVKAINVDGVVGSELSALDGSFPISRSLFMFTSGYPKDETLRFINYVLEPSKGQKFVKNSGFVSLYEPQMTPNSQTAHAADVKSMRNQIDNESYHHMGWREKVLLVQQYLSELKYPVGPIDGKWGRLTEAALTQFQQDHSLLVDGKITYKLLRNLNESVKYK